MLYLRKKLYSRIIEHCRSVYPKEACGILSGKDARVSKVYQMSNVSSDALHCYFMDSKEQLKVSKEIRNDNLDMLAIYHSHAYTEAYPSAKDVELAYYPDSLYIIISLKDEGTPVLRAYWITNNNIKEEKLEVS